MTKEKLAEILDGRPIGNEVSKDILDIASKYGFLIVFGASDDLIEFYGLFYDEAGAPDEILIDREGVISIDDNEREVLEKFGFYRQVIQEAKSIKAIWNDDGNPVWTYETKLPHAKFTIWEDEEKYCEGIVISGEDL